MLKIGSHLSTVGGYLNMAKTAKEIGANTFQYFSRNPRGGKSKPANIADITACKAYCKENDIYSPIVHSPYTLNFAACNPATRSYSKQIMKEDFEVLENFDSSMYVIHPGSHTELRRDLAMSYIIEHINSRLKLFSKTTALLETMSGKGSEIGYCFKELGHIIRRIQHMRPEANIGVCFDTCHLFASGYDIVNGLDQVLDEFDKEVGLKYLKAVHLNDSANDFGSYKDKHAKIGEGKIGADAIINIINNPRLKDLPFYLETPNDLEGYAKEIAFLKQNYGG